MAKNFPNHIKTSHNLQSCSERAMSQRRIRRGANEEQDAAQLKLGEEFQSAHCLFISELRILLEAQRESKDRNAENRPQTNVLQKTMTYVQSFSRFTNMESVREVRSLLKESELSHFEIAQLANLCCDDAEEAKALIPSLHNKIDDDRLQELMNQMLTIKKFQG